MITTEDFNQVMAEFTAAVNVKLVEIILDERERFDPGNWASIEEFRKGFFFYNEQYPS